MIKTEMVTTPPVPEKTEEKITAIVCDLCKNEVQDRDWESPDWARGQWDEDEITILRRHGENYGQDGGDIAYEAIHLCPKCWPKLIEWFKAQGVEPSTKNVSW